MYTNTCVYMYMYTCICIHVYMYDNYFTAHVQVQTPPWNYALLH